MRAIRGRRKRVEEDRRCVEREEREETKERREKGKKEERAMVEVEDDRVEIEVKGNPDGGDEDSLAQDVKDLAKKRLKELE